MVEEACSNVKYSLVTSWTLYSKCKTLPRREAGTACALIPSNLIQAKSTQ